jgi:CPA2 family monovalent cation:H+ antiporter-2
MAQASPLVADFAVVLGVATVTGSIARALRQPPILGYLLAGLLVGPYIPLPLFADAERVQELSELGVVLVMFAVGLEFRLSRAAKVLPIAGLAAAVQIAGMFWAGSLLGVVFGLTTAGQVVLGASLAVSSTMVVTKVFEVHKPPLDVRGLVLGVLVLQDIVAIILIAVVTAVAEGANAEPDQLLGVAGKLAGVIVIGGLVGLVFVPRVTRIVARLETPEVDTVFAVGLCFALGGFMQWLGYSPALGAFLAGTLVAESGLATRYEHLVAPIRDVFAAIFFVSIGMQVDPQVALRHIPETLMVAATVIALQGVLITSAGLLSGLGLRRSAHGGLALGQLGEFAFIMLGIGAAAKIVPQHLFTVIVGTAVLTTFTTSLGLAYSDPLLARLEHAVPRRFRSLLSMYTAWVDGVRQGGEGTPERRRIRRSIRVLVLDATAVAGIVIAASLAHRPVEAWLETRSLSPWLAEAVFSVVVAAAVLPFVRAMWRAARALGGHLAGVTFPKRVKVPDLTMTSRVTVTRALQLAALLAAGLFVVAVTRPFVPPGAGLLALLAVLVPSGVSLWRSGGPLDAHVRSATAALFDLLRRGDAAAPENPQLEALLHGLGDVTPCTLPAGAPAIGETLASIDLRARTGASVLAIVDDKGEVSAPTGREPLSEGAVLALAGPRSAIARARGLLLGGPEGDGETV